MKRENLVLSTELMRYVSSALIRSDVSVRFALKTSAFESFYGGLLAHSNEVT